MNEMLKRRELVRAVAAAGSLLVLGGAATAEPARTSTPAGEWLNEGKEDEPCAIFVHGRVLLVINENGDLATARMSEARKFVIIKGDGWEDGLVGEIAGDGKAITWTNGSTWKRP